MLKNNKKQLITCGVLLILLIIINIFRITSSLSDFFSVYISQTINTIIGTISNIIPFSLFEMFVIGFILFMLLMIIYVIKQIINKNKNGTINNTFIIIISILFTITLYTGTCGVAYQRSAAPLPYYNDEVSTELIDNTIEYYLEDYNKIVTTFEQDKNGISKCPYTFKELAAIMMKECDRLNENPYFYKFTGRPKATWFSPILSELHITGVDFPFTAEANINNAMPYIDIPFTMAHEIAHLKGVMRETDANNVALYICITSNNPYVRYSGYFRGFSQLLEIKAYTNHAEYKNILTRMNSQIFKDNNYYYQYFVNHNILEKISTFINDIYLFLNGEKEGTDSYIDKSETESTGKTDEEGNEIRVYKNYSPYQKLLFQNYLSNN